ncbi:MAG: hypothetical protein ABJF10_26550 [Chthoniobacter sp.]|uniref:hypothetical protein n=1 Tax=Chthoniobacter sp. TaxID=2510640 RepID=UPI0032AB0D0C
MKYFPPLALALLLSACAIPLTPEDREAAHQLQLQKEARENFIALKAQEHPGRPPVLHDEAPAPAPKPGLFAFGGGRQPAPTPAPVPHTKAERQALRAQQAQRAQQPQAQARPAPPTAASYSPPAHFVPTSKAQPPRKVDDTVYYWEVQNARQRISPRQQAAEAKYARRLAKTPETLTPEERIYAHEHF